MISRLACLLALLGCAGEVDSAEGGTSEGGGASSTVEPCDLRGFCDDGEALRWQCPPGPIGPPMQEGDVCAQEGDGGLWCCASTDGAGCVSAGACDDGRERVTCTTRETFDAYGAEHAGCALVEDPEPAWCCDAS